MLVALKNEGDCGLFVRPPPGSSRTYGYGYRSLQTTAPHIMCLRYGDGCLFR